MGLSGIAKAPVSHGVEPHDLETGGLALASALAFRLYRSSLSPPLPRERFSARAESGPTKVALGKAGVQTIPVIPSRVRSTLHHCKRTFAGPINPDTSQLVSFRSASRELLRRKRRAGPIPT